VRGGCFRRRRWAAAWSSACGPPRRRLPERGKTTGFAAARRIPLELETPSGDDHYVGSSMPFSDEASSQFDPRLGRGCNPSVALELGGEGRQPPEGRLRQAAERDLLNAISERPHHKIATQARRVGATEPPPFLAHRGEVERLKSREPIRDGTRTVARRWRSQHVMGRQRTRVGPLLRDRGESLGAIAGGRVCSRPPFRRHWGLGAIGHRREAIPAGAVAR
jgi:hypothetical protein